MFGYIWITILVFFYGSWLWSTLKDFVVCFEAYKKGDFLPFNVSTIAFIVIHIIALFVASLLYFLKGVINE